MKKIFIFAVIIIGLTYGGYRILLSYASDYLVDQVANEILADDGIEKLLEDPQVGELLDKYNSETSSGKIPENMAFSTKEEATKVLVSNFTVSEIKDITAKASRGLTSEEQAELEAMVLNRLTPEEVEALWMIGISEFSGEFTK
ncbi:hypothetical protein [Salipaludibacillus sp. CF4.18]|uniref:hypothetical protein n=1 Tax=Salipaludibacillus sp. CF4.18 TaxID=3373081 RepID=UPI003EE7E51E